MPGAESSLPFTGHSSLNYVLVCFVVVPVAASWNWSLAKQALHKNTLSSDSLLLDMVCDIDIREYHREHAITSVRQNLGKYSCCSFFWSCEHLSVSARLLRERQPCTSGSAYNTFDIFDNTSLAARTDRKFSSVDSDQLEAARIILAHANFHFPRNSRTNVASDALTFRCSGVACSLSTRWIVAVRARAILGSKSW